MANQNQTSPIEVEKFLKGMDYPADKEELVRCAEDSNAPQEVMTILNRMPDGQYGSPTDVAKGVSQVQ